VSKSIYKNAFFKGILSFCNIVVPLLVVPYVYRVLDPKTIGSIEYGNTLFIYFFIFGSLGIYGYGLREISKVREKPELVEKIYHNLFSIGLISNGIAFVLFILFVLFGFKSGSFQNILLIFSLGLISNALYTEWINEAYEEFFFITLKTLIIRVLSVVAIFLFISSETDFYLYVFITVLVLFLNNLVSFIYALRFTRFSFNLKSIEWKKYLPPLFFILVLNNTNVFYTILDRTLLGVYTRVESIAFYSLGQKIMEIIRALLMTAIFVSMPRLSFYLGNDYVRYRSALKDLSKLILFIAIPTSIGLILMSKEVVLLFAGEKYSLAILTTQIFSIRILVLSLESIISQQILFLHGKERIIIIFNISFGLLNLALKYIFLRFLSAPFAIATTTLCEILLISGELIYVKHYLKLNINIFSKSTALYTGTVLLFIPIIYVIRLLIHGNLYVLLLSVFCCALLYLGTMIVFRDHFSLQLINEIKRIISVYDKKNN
jgi:O-antigen/teichoic acid export membrane protein